MAEELIELEEKLIKIINSMDTNILKFINPTNLKEQKEKFFKELEKKNEYNPIFSYASKNPIFAHFQLNPEFEEITRDLKDFVFEDIGFGRILNKKRNDVLKKMHLIRSIGTNDFTEKSIDFYGKPKKSLVNESLELMNFKEKPLENIPAEKIASTIERFINKKNIPWKTEITNKIAAKATVFNSEKTILIKENSFFSVKDMKRIILHEIETHVYRYLNGLMQPFKLFVTGTDRKWLMTEEGLAVVNEELFKLSSKQKIKTYAGRVLAIDYALNHSFYETFDFLRNYFSKEDAFDLTVRAKRGLNDSSKKGAFTKDFFYLEGRKQVKKYLEEGNKIQNLYYGKISIDGIKNLTEIPKLKKPKYLPDYKKVNIKKYVKN